MAYNEETNIEALLQSLLHQELKSFTITEIIVVCSGCTDKTVELATTIAKSHKCIKIICESERKGKCSAINLFLKEAKSEILVLESGDTLPNSHAIERLCLPMKEDEKIGICASHPKPFKYSHTFLDFVIKLQWKMQHLISLQSPKYGELISFRNVFSSIPESSVDEEEIANLIYKQDYIGKYVPTAIVHNHGPTNIKEFIEQRRRIYGGHLLLRFSKKHKVPTMNSFVLFSYFLRALPLRKFLYGFFAILIELYARFLGFFDVFVLKKKMLFGKYVTQLNIHSKPIILM